jgi:hypothetical protein
MGDANEDDPLRSRVSVEDQCLLEHITRRQFGVDPIRITLKNAIPEHAPCRYRLHLGEQSTHAVADEYHVLRFGIKLIDSGQTLPGSEGL